MVIVDDQVPEDYFASFSGFASGTRFVKSHEYNNYNNNAQNFTPK